MGHYYLYLLWVVDSRSRDARHGRANGSKTRWRIERSSVILCKRVSGSPAHIRVIGPSLRQWLQVRRRADVPPFETGVTAARDLRSGTCISGRNDDAKLSFTSADGSAKTS